MFISFDMFTDLEDRDDRCVLNAHFIKSVETAQPTGSKITLSDKTVFHVKPEPQKVFFELLNVTQKNQSYHP